MLTGGAALGFWRATRLPESQVHYRWRSGSLLAANFNGLWVDALNLARTGRRVDYFAMIHGDVEPPIGWLDTLIDELEAHDLDILGAAVPIKDPNGLTSLALARPDGDPWRPLCRLTTAEIHALPETFTSDDCGHPLLLNTGLWVCRFDPAWRDQVHFTINDRIVRDKGGVYHAQCEPEDWFFSRLLHELGLRIGATRKIPLVHKGPALFPSDRVWGEPFDSAYVTESQLPKPSAQWPDFPEDVDGWLTVEEGKALAELARDKRVLEIGSYCGKSTICMARTAEYVLSIDPHDGRGTPEAKPTHQAFKYNLARHSVAGKVDSLIGTLENVGIKSYTDSAAFFDLIFIDGAHDYASVASDITNALPLLSDDGILAFHDYRRHPGEHDGRWDPGVTQAVDELLARGGALLSRHGSVAVVRPPARSLVTSEV